MKHVARFAFLFVLLAARPTLASTCEELSSLKLPDATVTSAQSVAAGGIGPGADLPAFCRVAITSKPSSDSDIKATRDLMGEDFWSYGVDAANRKTLSAMARYSYEQGLAVRLVGVDEMFAASTMSVDTRV